MNRRLLGLIAILAVGLVLRMIGLQFGLPAVYNPDEVAIMARALGFAKGSLNPHNFLYPTLYFYVLFAWVGVYLASVWVTGGVSSLRALSELYFTNPTGIFTAGRALGVAAGTLTIGLVHRLGTTIGGRRTAAAAAIFLAVAPLHVRDSHYVKHDVPATLAVVAAYLAMTRIWPGRRAQRTSDKTTVTRESLLAGAVTGIAFSTHYYCIFLALPLTWVILMRAREQQGDVLKPLAIAALGSAVTFFALSPFLLVEPLTAFRDIVANRQIVVDRAVASGPFGPAAHYAAMLWRDAVGVPVIVCAIGGIVWMAVVDWRRAVLLLAFPVPFLLFITNTAPASRYLNPVLPFIALFAAWLLTRAAATLRLRSAVFWVAVIAAAFPAALASVRTDFFFRQDDTRTLARRYIESQIPDGTGILIQPYSVPLTMSRPALEEALTFHLGSTAAASERFQLQLGLTPYPTPAYRLVYLGSGGLDVDKRYVSMRDVSAPDGLDRLRRLGVAFIVFKRYNEADPDSLPFLTALAREGRLVAAFSPYRRGATEAEQARIAPFLHNTDTPIDAALERPGPPLEVWELNRH